MWKVTGAFGQQRLKVSRWIEPVRFCSELRKGSGLVDGL